MVHSWFAGSPQAGKPVPTNSCGVQLLSCRPRTEATFGVPTWMIEAMILSASISSVTSGGVLFGS